MVDQEVTEILAEIKKRVRSAQGKSVPATSETTENSAPATSRSAPINNGYASLPILARTWDRLPPVVSNRTGFLARLELWIKEKLKRASRWFTWEQVNFNAATYQTLLEVVESINAWEQRLAETKQELDAQLTQLAAQLAAQREAQREELKNQQDLMSSLTNQLEDIDRRHLALVAQLNARLEGLSQLSKDHQVETQTRFVELVTEFRQREDKLIDEQRVCYKQLALELSESRVLQDRARRELEGRVGKLETEK